FPDEAIHLDIRLRNRWVRGSWVAPEYLGREQLRVPDQPDDIVVAGENPDLVLGVPVDWVLRSEAAEVAIGIGDDVRSEQVVVDRGCHPCLSSLSLPDKRPPGWLVGYHGVCAMSND